MDHYLRMFALAAVFALFGVGMPMAPASAQSCNPAVQSCG